MKRVEIEGAMRELRGKMKAKWAQLTDDDIALIEAQIEQMVGMLQKRYGYAPAQARSDLEKYLTHYNEEAKNVLGQAFDRIHEQVGRVQERMEKVDAPGKPWMWGAALAAVAVAVVWFLNRNGSR